MRLRFLRWLTGFANIIDGILIILSLGYFDPNISSYIRRKCGMHILASLKDGTFVVVSEKPINIGDPIYFDDSITLGGNNDNPKT